MRNGKLLSVSEFAKAAGVSRSAIYQRLSTSLQGYVQVVQGEKRLDPEGLKLFAVQGDVQEFKIPIQAENNQFEFKILEVLEQTIDNLEEQLHEKDCQLAKQHQQLEEKDKQLERSDQALSEHRQLLKNSQELQGHLQVKITGPKEEKQKEPAHGPVSQEEKREAYDQGYLDGKNDLFEGLEKQVRTATVLQIKAMIRHIREGLVYIGEDGKVVDDSEDTVYIDACTDELKQLQAEAYRRGWSDIQALKKRWPWSK